MRSHIVPGAVFPDYALPDENSVPRRLSEIQGDDPLVLTLARGHMGMYLQTVNYTNNLRRLGWTDEDLADGGSDKLVDAIVAWGDARAIRARAETHLANGADHVCLQVLRADLTTHPLAEWRALAPALR